MKRLLLLYAMFFSFVALQAQPVDVTKVTADTKTYLFNDGKNTVKGYIYDRLLNETSCSGSDRIYLEVKVDPSGYVVSAKALTGKNDCLKESVVDIVKNIKWDAADFKGPKSIFFEVKPELPAEGRKNEYVQIATFNNPLINPTGSVAATPPQPQAQPVTPPSPATDKPAQPAQPSTPPATNPVATTQPAPTNPSSLPSPAVSQAMANSPVPVTPTYVPSIGNDPMSVTPPTPQQPPVVSQPPVPVKPQPIPPKPQPVVAQAVPPAPIKAGPTPADLQKARETEEEVALLRAEMDKRMKEEEGKRIKEDTKELASADKPEGDKKPGEGDDPLWTIDKGGEKKTKQECKPVLNKDGKPLVDKNGKPVMECKTVVVKDEAPAEPKLTPEQIAANKKAEEEARKKSEEEAKYARMTPEEKKRADEEKRRKDEEERYREAEKKASERIAEAEKKLRDSENARRKAEDEFKRQENEIKRAQEDLERAKVEAKRQKDEAELARIDTEKRALEEKKREQERMIQEKMRDITKMQQEMERLTGDLQKQQEDLKKAEERYQQYKAGVANGGVTVMETPSVKTDAPASPAPADVVATGDTATINRLMMQIDMLRQQLYRVQQEQDAMRSVNSAVVPGAPSTYSNVYSQGTSAATNKDWANMEYRPAQQLPPAGGNMSANPARVPAEAQNASNNRAWESIDYNNAEPLSKTEQGRSVIMNDLKSGKNIDSKAQRQAEKTPAAPAKTAPAPKQAAPQVISAPPAPKTEVVTNPAMVPPTAQAPVNYVSTGDKNPDASHSGTFANVPVNSGNAQLEYIDGDAGMKTYLKDQLKAQGACGWTHVFAEVNVDRNGNVATYKVLKCEPVDVVNKLAPVLLGLKFKTDPQTAPYTQTTYIEFKGEVRCEGAKPSKVDPKAEENYLKSGK